MFTMEVDTQSAVRAFNAILKQHPFAVSQALNDVAKEFRQEQREDMEETFTVRRPWVLTGVQIPRGSFARKSRLHVDVVVEDARSFLWKFETETEYEPVSGRFAVPVDVPRTSKEIIKKRFRPRELELRQHLLSGDTRFLGKQRTFVIEDSQGRGGIYQRVGRGAKSEIRLLYWFRLKTPIDPELDFEENAHRVFEESFQELYNRRFLEAIRTARV